MPEFYIDDEKIEITPSEFISECDNGELTSLIKELKNRDYISDDVYMDSNGVNISTPEEGIFEKHLSSLHGKRHMLSNEEEDIIMKIASKFLYL